MASAKTLFKEDGSETVVPGEDINEETERWEYYIVKDDGTEEILSIPREKEKEGMNKGEEEDVEMKEVSNGGPIISKGKMEVE